MFRKIILVGAVLVGMAAAADPLQVAAVGDSLASPTPQPTQRVTAPVISGENPEVYLSEGEQGDITPSDILEPPSLEIPELIPSPPNQPLEPLQLAVNFQDQGGEVNCGPASLAMALTYLNQLDGGERLSPRELGTWLEKRGLIYEWGTGVEELAYAARSFGYQGARALHDWSLDQLEAELRAGRPVVVSLGSSGPGQPGHFLTVTGMGPDGRSIFCQDPLQGAVEYAQEEFQSLWELQGNSALILRKEAASPGEDLSLPLMGLLSAVSALALALGLKGDQEGSKLLAGLRKELADPLRMGVGGGVALASPAAGKETAPPEIAEPPPGFKKIRIEVPVYETRQVQIGIRGIKKQVPVYETRKVFTGLRKDIQQVPVYGFKKVMTGMRWVEKQVPVTRYRTKQVWTWKKVTQRVPVKRWIHGKPIVVGYRNETRWKRVQVTKKVPYQSIKKLWVKEPVYSMQKVQTGTRTVTRWVPTYQEKQVQVGTRTVCQTVPVFESQRVQVSTRTVTRLVPISGDDSGPIGPGDDPGDDGGTERGSAQDVRLWDKLRGDHDQMSPPTGISRAVWDSLSEEDKARIRGDGLDLLREYYRQKELQDNRIYKWYRFGQTVKERITQVGSGLGLWSEGQDLPHLVSLSAQKEVPANLLTEDGIVIDTFRPPYFLDLFYMQQELQIKEKAIVTTFPDAPVDFNLSTRSISVKAGKITLFGDFYGNFGFSFAINDEKSNYEEVRNIYSIKLDINGIMSKYKKEGCRWEVDAENPLIKKKIVNTIECNVTIIPTKGIAILVLSGILLYLLLSSGAGVDLPSWQNLPSLSF